MPLIIEKVNTNDKAQVRRFVALPYRLYHQHPQWVPPPQQDIALMLSREKHPFYEHSDADFFVALRDGQVVGRVAAIENRPYNACHGVKQAQFYLFDCEDDLEIAMALFEHAFIWAKARGLDTVVGPKGFGPLDGYGLLVEGYEHRQMMTMMNYNYAYYSRLIDALGLRKRWIFVSCYLNARTFQLPSVSTASSAGKRNGLL